jgi:hypothetical protein
MRRNALFFGLALLVGGVACGGDKSSTTEPNGNGQTPTATNGTFSATIGNVNWGAQGTVTVSRQAGNFIGITGSGLIGTNNAYAVVLVLANATGPGTFSLSGNTSGSSLIIGGSTGGGWGTGFNGGTGSVTITTLTTNRIVGTFTADAVAGSGGATGTLQVRNGKIDITF